MEFSGLAPPMGFLWELITTGREGRVIAEARDVLSIVKQKSPGGLLNSSTDVARDAQADCQNCVELCKRSRDAPDREGVARRIPTLMPWVVAAVRETSEWTPEGRLARRRLRAWMRRVRKLAEKTHEPGVVESVEKVLGLLRSDLPEHFKAS